MTEAEISVHTLHAVDAALCAVLASYTFISILDHERWMKEWGDEHEAVAVMHLRVPILSAAITIGVGGLCTVHQVALGAMDVGDSKVKSAVFQIILVAVASTLTMLAMIFVARKDAFAGIDRVDILKKTIHGRYTIAQVKNDKHLGRKIAYFGQLQYIAAAAVILASGVMGCWALNVTGLEGDFIVVWRTWPIVWMALFLLLTSMASVWLLFRVLVWKPAREEYRPLCAIFFALQLWSVDHFGKTHALRYESLDGRTPNGNFGWSLGAGRDGGTLFLELLAFVAFMTQYAIASELRNAYCGLQDANLDLLQMTSGANIDEQTRKSSALSGGPRRHTAQGRTSPHRARRRTSQYSISPETIPVSPPQTMKQTLRMTLAPTTEAVGAILKMGSAIGRNPISTLRSVRVEPADDGSSVISEALNSLTPALRSADGSVADRASDASEEWAVVEPKGGGAVLGVGPATKVVIPTDNV